MSLRSRPLLTAVAPVLLAGVLLAACGGDDSGAAPTSTSTTTSAPSTDSSGPSAGDDDTTTTVDASSQVVLRGDGLGAVDLGAEPDTAVAAVTAVLGEPTRDSGWEPSFSGYGTCPGERIRGVEWDHLVLLFTDGSTDYGSGEHLFAWRITGAPPALGTATGFGYQATAADAEDLYPGHVESVPAEEPFPAFLEIEAEGGKITAYLDDSGTVTNIEAGAPCGE